MECATCHREIYQRYRTTPMANASGPAVDGFIPGEFVHAASGVHFRVAAEAGQVWLSYERESASSDNLLKGEQNLRYFIGSGKRGRTYLFERSGYWFESPINWYSKKQIWDMAPNFQSATEVPLTLPVDPGCLHCHASNVARSLPDARNLYAGEPFANGGITCVSCHGDGSAHISSGGKVRMLDINALQPVRRDSVCLNCHLEGQTAVIRYGKQMENFTPGDDLFDYALYFVYKTENGSGGRATSQWEALLRSECKKISGDRLTCTTCHDPHGSPSPDDKVAFYRQKCLQCHRAAEFAERHHPENPDCIACHMARPTSTDIAHEQVTDHWIKKRISNQRPSLADSGSLETIGGTIADDRDLGIAYAQMAARGNEAAGKMALKLLQKAEHTESGARRDHELHAQLGFLEQMDGQTTAAIEEYQLALQSDPYDYLAGADLALLRINQREYAEALQLLKAVFEHDPAQAGAGLNLAIVECGLGDRNSALATLDRLLEFSPDYEKAEAMDRGILSGSQKCGSR
ncbi:tetratricopeptide repeat protein [Telmatobacter sp. DSM 110680]|uniref:Tetratricopeptide repeat protein n=1 Tax=Telmatobacter sp. DSM 110680 TaxID=3036704 RepID=A0AAU7DL40_9BACT